jgi:hypothetical protein
MDLDREQCFIFIQVLDRSQDNMSDDLTTASYFFLAYG